MRRPALHLVGLVLLTAGAHAALETAPLRGLRAEVAALLVQGVSGGSLPIAVAVFPQPAGDAGTPTELSFLMELPPAPEPTAEAERPLEVYAYAVDASGEVAAHYAVILPGWPAEGEGVKVSGRLEVPAGDLSLRFLAWDPTARRYGLTVRQVTFGATAVSPRIEEECAGWSVAGAEATSLLDLSARSVLVSGETRRLSLGRATPAVSLGVEFVKGAGGAATREWVAASVVASDELEFLVPDLAAGIYQLAVNTADGATWSSRSIEIWLVPELPPPDHGCRRGWRRILRQARDGAPVVRSESAPAAAELPFVQSLAADYQGLLGRLALAGDLTLAAGELADLEVPLVEDDPARAARLFEAELKTVRSIAERDPRSLLPIIALHAETYRLHHGSGRFSLATHSRRLAAAIAKLAADLAEEPEERVLVAVAITGLADLVETRRASIEAQRLLERALSLDPSQEAAQLLLAVSYERRGYFADARRQLEELVSANSAHYEARVRLAILLRRIGETEEAERLARAVVAERPPAWLLSLGYQTLAQLLIRDARPGEAVAELEAAAQRLPDDQALKVLRAYALDRSGERRVVQRTLAELPLAAAGLTPRYRYSDKPAAELGLLRETLRQSVTVRLPVLAVAVGAERSRGPAG